MSRGDVDSELDAAVAAWVEARDPGKTLASFVVVMASVDLDELGSDEARSYYGLRGRKNQAPHISMGLLAVGQQLMTEGWDVD